MVKIIISGVCGKMGTSILHLAKTDKDITVAGATEARSHPRAGKTLEGLAGKIETDLGRIIGKTDVVIEFTNPETSLDHLRTAEKAGKGIVIGTTGFKESEIAKIKKASVAIPVVFSPNMSAGVNLLYKLACETARAVPGYDVEIIEIHHNQKKDAPSGTAKKLAQMISETLNSDLAKTGVYGREGLTGPRKPGEIGIHSVRAGDTVGEHTVIFAGKGERIELVHRAQSRQPLAGGALLAAKWLMKQKAGLYSMQDVLGI